MSDSSLASTIARDDIAAWLRLTETPGVGAETARRLLAAFGPPALIFSQPLSSLRQMVPDKVALALRQAPDAALQDLIERTVDWVEQPGNYLLTLADSAYPAALLTLPDPPPMLYAKGRLDVLQGPAMAMVGARNATTQGVRDARQFAQALASGGLTVVSGLALGIDAAAHEGALTVCEDAAPGARVGATIAVIGTGADIVYPARNRALAHRIVAAGLIVSELPLGTPALAHQFPRRNRLIAALSRGVLVVEAAAQSGSLITARLAGELGREVFAMPGSIHSPLSKGCHRLIRQGAKLVETAQDILEELHFDAPAAAASAPPARPEADVGPQPGSTDLLAALSHAPVGIDTLCATSGLDAAAVSAQLLELELAGRLERLPGERFRLLG